jgi:RNA polymerase primary sigma factor
MLRDETTARAERVGAELATPGRSASDRATKRRADETYDDPDLVRFYLDEIGATPLLSAAEEVELAKRIEAGVYAERLLHEADAGGTKRRLSAKRRHELELAAQDGARARDHMIRANLRLVVSVAKKYSGRDVPFLDVIQEGNLGLIRAVEKFDYEKGFKFSTYAMWWIRQAIQRGMAEQSRTVRLPVHVVEDLSRLGRAQRELRLRLGREPSPEEVAAEADRPLDKVVELLKVARQPVSLDTPVGEDGETRVGDLIEDADALVASELVEFRGLADELRALVDTLAPREALIVAMRFGLYDGHPRTLQEIANHLGLTRERVRQLEKESLAALRDPERHRALLAWAG